MVRGNYCHLTSFKLASSHSAGGPQLSPPTYYSHFPQLLRQLIAILNPQRNSANSFATHQFLSFFMSLSYFSLSLFLSFFIDSFISFFLSTAHLYVSFFLKKSFNWKNVVTKLLFPLKANFWYSFVMFSLEKLFRNRIRFSILATLSKLGCWKTERGVKFEGKMDATTDPLPESP